MKAHEFEKKFDDGDDLDDQIDWSKARRPYLESKRISVDVPVWIVEKLDQQAKAQGVTRQVLIRTWIAEHLI